MSSLVAHLKSPLIRAFHFIVGWLVIPALRPFYRLAQRILIRMLIPSMMPTQQGAYQFRGFLTHPKRPHPLMCDPARCLHPFTAEELTLAGREAARNRLGIPSGQHIIASLGMITHDRGPMPCIHALDQLHYWGVSSHLYYLGPIQPEIFGEIRAWVNHFGLTDAVHFYEQPLDNETYRDLLIASDCAIQIQTHLPGTFSGALLDCLSAGLPTICNADLALTMNTPRFVTTIPDELSPLLIAEKLLELYKLREMHPGDNTDRTRNAAEHSATNYSPQILKLLLAS